MNKVRWLVMVSVMALMLASCTREGEVETEAEPPAKQLSATAPSSVKGNIVTITIADPIVKIVKADGDTSGETGHFHVFIDREPVAKGVVIPKEPGIVHSTDSPLKLTGLTVGSHKLVLVLGDGAHQRIGAFESRFTVNVQGPAVQATVPATNPAGQPVVVSLKAEGVTIKAADGDISGSTGHFHVFIDRDPSPAGQAIPKEAGIIHTTEGSAKLDGLAPGEHFIWVVVGDGNHVPLADSNVAHKVTFAVQ